MSRYPDELEDAFAIESEQPGADAGAPLGRVSRAIASVGQWWAGGRQSPAETAAGEDQVAGIGSSRWVFWSMVTVAVVFMAYGFYLGNPFETYHNGSTL